MTIYVSSAYLTSLFCSQTGFRSLAVTTYDAGPTAEPCIMLADYAVCLCLSAETIQRRLCATGCSSKLHGRRDRRLVVAIDEIA